MLRSLHPIEVVGISSKKRRRLIGHANVVTALNTHAACTWRACRPNGNSHRRCR